MLATALLMASALGGVSPGQAPHAHTHPSGAAEEVEGPILLETIYTGEVMTVAAGGLRRGARYLDNLDIVLEADLEQLAGWRGAELQLYGLYNNGKSISALVGDTQAVSNIETGRRKLRLYEAWINQRIGSRMSVRAGRYDLNSEFDSLETSGLFLNSAHGIGTDISQSGLNGPSIFPETSLALRFDVKPAAGWVLRAAILGGGPGDVDRLEPGLRRNEGALLIGEAEMPVLGGRLLLGHWRYTARFESHAGRRARGNGGIYLRGEAPIAAGRVRQLAGFFRLGTASGRFNMFGGFASAGLKLTGWRADRAEDELGLAVATAFTSRNYRLANASGKSETALELTYRTRFAPWLTVQPNIQYVIDPSADPTIANALVMAIRFEASFRPID